MSVSTVFLFCCSYFDDIGSPIWPGCNLSFKLNMLPGRHSPFLGIKISESAEPNYGNRRHSVWQKFTTWEDWGQSCLLPTLVSQTSDFPKKEKEHHTLFTGIGIWLKFLQTIVCQAAWHCVLHRLFNFPLRLVSIIMKLIPWSWVVNALKW